jgi:nitrate/nitrite transport system substrate-binding protein
MRYAHTLLATLSLAVSVSAWSEPLALEQDELKFGFIKLTDMAPLAVAYELGYFEDEGLFVTLEPQANWKVLLDRVITGELDGAHMLAGQPLGATIGFGTNAHVVTAFSMDLNGNGITVSNEVWRAMKPHVPAGADGKPIHPIKADALKPVVEAYRAAGKPFNMGMVFPVSTHNYELRYWLAAGGIHPGYYSSADINGQTGADVLLSVTPPPQMPATLEAGTIYGYSVGEPWNQQAVIKGIGVPVITDYEIWRNNPEKVFGVTEAWAKANPNTHIAVVKALIRAAMWLDANANANRAKAVEILARSQYVGADAAVIANSMTGTFEYERGDKRAVPDFNVFFRYFANYPYYSDAIWYLTQLGPDQRAETRRLVRGNRALRVSARRLLEGRATARRRRARQRAGFSVDDRWLSRTSGRVHRRRRLRRSAAERVSRAFGDRPQGYGYAELARAHDCAVRVPCRC